MRFMRTWSTSSHKVIVSFGISTIAGPQEVNDKEETGQEDAAKSSHSALGQNANGEHNKVIANIPPHFQCFSINVSMCSVAQG